MPVHRHPAHRPCSRRLNLEPVVKGGGALLIIDETPLKNVAWAEFHAARRRQEKSARDLHRHEEIDSPAHDAWLHRTFPTLITRLRQLHEEVFAKGQRVQSVQAMSAFTGRSARKIWREQKEAEANPDAFERDHDSAHRERWRGDASGFDDDFFDDEDDSDEGSRGQWDDVFEPRVRASRAAQVAGVRDVYRRLVQRLHPDRGGEWTAARQRLWYQVQEAWATGDADWLIRLEVEWEAAHDVLTPASPLSRLRAAIAEIHAARRDIDRKLREYRNSPAWRFTLAKKKREELSRRTELNFKTDIAFLERQLAYLNATIARWEAPARRRRSGVRPVEVRFCE